MKYLIIICLFLISCNQVDRTQLPAIVIGKSPDTDGYYGGITLKCKDGNIETLTTRSVIGRTYFYTYNVGDTIR